MQNTDSKVAAQLITNHLLTGQPLARHPYPQGQINTNGQPGQPYPQGQINTNGQPGQPYPQGQINTNGQPGQPYPQGQIDTNGQPYPQGQINTNGQPGQPYPQGQINTNGQPGQSIELAQRGEPADVVPGDPTADFGVVYRTGNFGKHFGKVNVYRGKRWVFVHGGLALFMFVFTLAASIMMNNYTKGSIRSILLACSWMATVSDCFTVLAAAFFIWRLSNLRHPLMSLMVMRFFAAFNLAFNMFFFLVAILTILLNQKDFIALTKAEVDFLKVIFAIISLLMMIKMITAYAFLCMWWTFPACCQCCGPYCIFEEGRELAPGVDNSAGVENVILVGQIAGVMAQEMN